MDKTAAKLKKIPIGFGGKCVVIDYQKVILPIHIHGVLIYESGNK